MRILNAVLFSLVAIFWQVPVWKELQTNNYRVPYYQPVEAVDILIEGFCALVFGVSCALLGRATPYGALWVGWVGCLLFLLYRFYLFAKERTHVRMTKRMWRLALPCAACAVAAQVAAALLLTPDGFSQAVGSAVLPLVRPFVCLVNVLLRPFETWNNNRYIAAAHKKILASSAVRIAITGSFGKTSCKNILKSLLEPRYRVIASEGNRNTPLGLIPLANGMQQQDCAIAEMGARRKGDIAQLCAMFPPKYAIETGVGEQHLESFRNLEGVYRTKKELIDALPPDGFAVFNGENPHTVRMAQECACKHGLVGFTPDCALWADEIVLGAQGTAFTLHGWGDEIRLNTRLLGRHNVLNVLMAAALARELGVSKEEVCTAIGGLQPIPHRLELVSNARGITIIDDSYNANIEGVLSGFEVLSHMEGRKVVFMQGVVELGHRQRSVNCMLGKQLAPLADWVLLRGENAPAIRDGLLQGGFDADHIFTFSTLEQVSRFFAEELRPNDVLLIQNDIP